MSGMEPIADYVYDEWSVPEIHTNEYGTTFGEGTDYNDAGYPGLFEPEIRYAGMHGGGHAIAEVDPTGDPVPPDFGGTPGGVNNNVRSETGVVDLEDFELRGRVEVVPSSTDWYLQNSEGPVGTRSVNDEVGDAVIFDHLDYLPDPYTVRDDLIGAT